MEIKMTEKQFRRLLDLVYILSLIHISSGGQLPVPPALCPHGGDTQIPTLPLYV